MAEEKIICETPTPGKKPTRIPKWKYQAVRKAIIKSVPSKGEGLLFKDLAQHVVLHLTEEERIQLGSPGWHTTTVKLDMEVKGEIHRVPGVKPQRLLCTVRQ